MGTNKKSQKKLSAQLQPPNHTAQAQATFQQAFSFHQKGDLSQARTLYEALLDAQPRHFEGLHCFGILAYQTNQPQAAAELISKAIAVDPKQAAPYSNVGMVFQALNQLDDALASYDNAIVRKPDYAEAHYNRGNVLKTLNRLEEAVASYDKAIVLVPFYFQAHLNRGNTLTQLARPEDALVSYDKAISINPNYFQAYFNRGSALASLQRWKEALADFGKALSLKPDHADTYRNRGDVLTKIKQLDAALADYDKAISLNPDFVEAHYNRGTTLFNMQRFDEAQYCYEKVIALQPDNRNALYALAALTKQNIPNIAPRAYVANLFDTSADTFDQHLVDVLDYHIPSILAVQFGRHAKNEHYDILDLGCGTGLSGEAFHRYARRLVGVDLSTRMLEKAKFRALYDDLVCADIVEFLQLDQEPRDLIICADVFVYIGGLEEVFAGVKNALKSGGWFSFSVETADTDSESFELKQTQRYGHSLRYIQSIVESFGFILKETLSTNLRKEREEYLPGYAFLIYNP